MRIRTGSLAIVTVLSLSACATDGGGAIAASEPVSPTPPAPLGVYEIAIAGIGAAEMRSTITPARTPHDGEPAMALTAAVSGLVFEQVTSTSFTEGTRTSGGQRYVAFTYRVRNSTGTALKNVTLMMVSRTGNLLGSTVSSVKRFDGSDADPAIAYRVAPTGAVAMGSDLVTMNSVYPDVMQVFNESEVAPVTPLSDAIVNYGYVVRRSDPAATTRVLPAVTDPNQYDGVLTVSFRVPLQPTSAQDVFSIVFPVMIVQDSETRLTETIEEGQDSAAVRRLRERATALGATIVTVMEGSPTLSPDVPDYPGQRQKCGLTTVGTRPTFGVAFRVTGAYSRLEILLPGESTAPCSANFRSGSPTVPVVGTPYPVTVKAMDRYGNLLNHMVDTVTLSRESGPSATFGAPVALVNGQATINVTYIAAGANSVLVATGRRIRTQRTLPVGAMHTP